MLMPDLFTHALDEWFCPVEGKPGIWFYNGDPLIAEKLSEGKDGFADTQILSLSEYFELDNEVDEAPETAEDFFLPFSSDNLYSEKETVELEKQAAVVATNWHKAAEESPKIAPFFLRLAAFGLLG